MSRPKNTTERRQQIIDGLYRAMAVNGYEGASISQIARAAGLTPGLVHYHFHSKQDVLVALVAQVTDSGRARVSHRLSNAGEGRPKVAACLQALLGRGEGADETAVACWALIGAEAVRQPEVRELWASYMNEAKKLLAKLIRETCVLEGRQTRGCVAMATGLLATVEGYVQLGAAAPSVVPKGTAANMSIRMANGLIDSQAFINRRR